jgi:hypothetical protein
MRIDWSLSAIATLLAPLALLVPITELTIAASAILLGQPDQGKAQLIVILLR